MGNNKIRRFLHLFLIVFALVQPMDRQQYKACEARFIVVVVDGCTRGLNDDFVC